MLTQEHVQQLTGLYSNPAVQKVDLHKSQGTDFVYINTKDYATYPALVSWVRDLLGDSLTNFWDDTKFTDSGVLSSWFTGEKLQVHIQDYSMWSGGME